MTFLERQFALIANRTNVQTEVVAGLTTFLTMCSRRSWPDTIFLR